MAYRPPLSGVTRLTERNGAPRHEDEKQQQLIVAAVSSALDERDGKLLAKMQALVERLDMGIGRLFTVVEGFAAGERDTAVATMTEGDDDDLPSVSRFKAEPSSIYTLDTTHVAQNLGVSRADVAYLLNASGLGWVDSKDDMWDHKTHQNTKRRFWHPCIVKLLRSVILDDGHPDRTHVTPGCLRVLARCRLTLVP